jgi:serine/threonine-protein kinase ATR
MHSLVRPKKITFIGSNGKKYGILCKAKDDLRKDCKVMEVNSVVNSYLHRNPESSQRQLQVRIYTVTPLNEEHGLLEWVPNLTGFRGTILSLLRDRGISVPMRDLRLAISKQ